MAHVSRLTSALKLTLIVCLLASAGSHAVASPQSDVEPAQALAGTRVTLNFTGNGCLGCVVIPTQLILGSDNDGREVSWNDELSMKRTVRGDSLSFTVPTQSTRGMTFMIQAPATKSGAFYDATPLVVFQYQGYSPGEWVERAEVVTARGGSPCWAGTNETSVSFDVNVRAVTRKGLNDTPGGSTFVRVPIAWIAPTEQAFGGFTKTDRGIVAAQDVYPCGGA